MEIVYMEAFFGGLVWIDVYCILKDRKAGTVDYPPETPIIRHVHHYYSDFELSSWNLECAKYGQNL